MSIAIAAISFFAAETAIASSLRYGATLRGGIAITGNTLGLSKALSENGPGTSDSIGTFIAADAGSTDVTPPNPSNPWPSSTTASWSANGSSAVLDLPDGHEVVYAELVWGGSYAYSPEDVSVFLDDPILLSFEGTASTSVSSNPTTSHTLSQQSVSGFPANYYVRSNDVTDFVRTHGGGTYAASGIPATQSELINSLNAAGWTLVVAYSHSEAPWQYLAVAVSGDWVDEESSATVAFDGFLTPEKGPVTGRLLSSAIEGDASVTGDQLLFQGPSDSAFIALEGPNNPADNFFASQLNGDDGLLDTRGSFGLSNHDAEAGLNVSGGRQGWDVAVAPLSDGSGALATNLDGVTVRATTTGDSYVLTLVALEIDAVPEPGGLALHGAALLALAALRSVGTRSSVCGGRARRQMNPADHR